MKKQSDQPYLDKPSTKKTTKEQLIYGGGDTLEELSKKTDKDSKILLTE